MDVFERVLLHFILKSEIFSDRFSQQGYSMSQFMCICPALHVVHTDLNIDVDFKVKFLRIAPLKSTGAINLI